MKPDKQNLVSIKIPKGMPEMIRRYSQDIIKREAGYDASITKLMEMAYIQGFYHAWAAMGGEK